MTAAVGLRQAVLRVLLFGTLAVGVLSMHTVGHSTGHDGWSASLAMTASDAGLTDSDHGCDPWSCAAALAAPVASVPGPGPAHGHTGIVIMCLAVLAGAGFLVLLAAALNGRRRWLRPPERPQSPGRVAAARTTPTSNLAVRLVEVAVLRT